MDLQGKKEELRKECLIKRSALPQNEWEEKSARIIEHILQSKEYKHASVIHCFISMNSRKEVKTDELLRQMLLTGKKVVVPVTDFEKGILIHSQLNSMDDLRSNKWGVREPASINPVHTEEPELILVPLLAADDKGNRLGYGKGFYDLFLERTDTPAFGLIFTEFIFEEIPVEPFDVKLDGLFSEEGIIYT